MARIALTGASGFIGRALLATLLNEGHEVCALVRRPLPELDGTPGFEPVAGDLEDVDALSRLVRDADVVVHLAGLVKALNRREFFGINAECAGALAALAVDHAAPGARFVLASSLTAREPALSHYGASKAAAEREVRERGVGLDMVALRLPAIYGPGDTEMLPLFDMMTKGWLLLPAGVTQRVTLLHVEDAAAALRAAAFAEGAIAGTYEVGDRSQTGHTWREIAGKLGNILQRLVRCVPVPKFLMSGVGILSAGWALLRGRPAMLTRAKVNELFHPDWVARDADFRRVTGWQPQIDIETGIAWTLAWYREAGWIKAPRLRND